MSAYELETATLDELAAALDGVALAPSKLQAALLNVVNRLAGSSSLGGRVGDIEDTLIDAGIMPEFRA